MGIKPESMPILSSWHETWSLVIRNCPTAERVGLFLQTLDSWDTYESTLMSEETKTGILREWVAIYADHELIAEPHGRINANSLDQFIKDWVSKYIPHTVFNKLYNRTIIRRIASDVLLKCGYRVTSISNVKCHIGCRFRVPPSEEFAERMPESVPLPPLPSEATKAVVKNTVADSNVVHLGTV